MSEKILSVGIDIGTSTTCVIFSDLTIENVSASMRMPKVQIVEKNVRYRGPIYFTPLLSNTELDTGKIAEIVEREYQSAGVLPQDVKTGAVIITGDTARKENAQSVLHSISKYAGDFVVATAGPALESILAGKGSGAEQYSRDCLKNVCNMDIGGGTTNTAAFYRGNLIDADCMDIGGRLIRFREGTREIAYIFHKIQKLAQDLGVDARPGVVLTEDQIRKITDSMARAMLEKLKAAPTDPQYVFLKTESGGGCNPAIGAVSFSGGVGKLIYERELPNPLLYSDIGVFLAESIKGCLPIEGVEVIRPAETISATVIGAGNHSMEVSGSTITISDFQDLPIQNLPILKLEGVLEMPGEALREEIGKRLRWIQGQDREQNAALYLDIRERMGFQGICRLAEKVIAGAEELLRGQETLVVITREDYGKVLGQSFQVRLPEGKKVVCIDSIDVGTGDFIDIGKPLGIGDAVPVVIKTLAFSY